MICGPFTRTVPGTARERYGHKFLQLRGKVPTGPSLYYQFAPSPTKPVLSPLSCPAPQVMPFLLLGNTPSLTRAARISARPLIPRGFLKTTKGGCRAEDSQNLAAHLFPRPFLDAGPAVRAAAQGSHGAGRAGEVGVAPHGWELGIAAGNASGEAAGGV